MYCPKADCRLKETKRIGSGCSFQGGQCDMQTGQCRCKEGFGGCDCSVNCRSYSAGCTECMLDVCLKCNTPMYFICPHKENNKCQKFCPDNCNGHTCNTENGECQCDKYIGGSTCKVNCKKFDPNCVFCDEFECKKCDFEGGYNPKPYCKQCKKKICTCNGHGTCDCDGNCKCYNGYSGPSCLGTCNGVCKGCMACSEDTKTRNQFTGKFIWRCSKCGPNSEYKELPRQTTSGSECEQQCPPGETLKDNKCVSCGTVFKFKYLATCSRFASDDICLTREDSNPETLDALIAGAGVKVTAQPCVRKTLDMNANKTRISANQMWLKRTYMHQLPPPAKNTGVEKPVFEKYYTLTIPLEWILKLKMVQPSVNYVPVRGKEYCLTSTFNGQNGKPTDQLTLQVCEYDKKDSPLTDLQLFEMDTVSCPDNSGSSAFRNMEYISLKKNKKMMTANPLDWTASFGGLNKTDGTRWTAFEEQAIPVC